MMKISLFSESLFSLSLQSAIELTAESGFPAIELACKAPHFDLETARNRAEDVAQAIERAGLDVAALSLYNNFTDPARLEEQIEAALFYIRMTPLFETDMIKLTPGPPDCAAATAEHWDCLQRALDRLSLPAEELGVRLAFETHMRQLTDTLEGSRRLLSMAHSPAVGLTVDFSNMAFAKEDMTEVISTLGGRMYHAHVKNGRIDADGAWRFLPLDEGWTDYTLVFSLLREMDYDGYLSLECLGPDARENPERTVKRDLAILRQFLKESEPLSHNEENR